MASGQKPIDRETRQRAQLRTRRSGLIYDVREYGSPATSEEPAGRSYISCGRRTPARGVERQGSRGGQKEEATGTSRRARRALQTILSAFGSGFAFSGCATQRTSLDDQDRSVRRRHGSACRKREAIGHRWTQRSQAETKKMIGRWRMIMRQWERGRAMSEMKQKGNKNTCRAI